MAHALRDGDIVLLKDDFPERHFAGCLMVVTVCRHPSSVLGYVMAPGAQGAPGSRRYVCAHEDEVTATGGRIE